MIHRRRAISVAMAALPAAWLLLSSVAYADQAFQRFVPFLVDLEGWQGKKPEGISMEMPGANMISATREYQRGPARLQAQIITGAAAQMAVVATQSEMNIENSNGRMNNSTIDGLRVNRSFTTKDQSGNIVVAVGASQMFSVSFKGVGYEDALTLAKKFDWKAIQAAAQLK